MLPEKKRGPYAVYFTALSKKQGGMTAEEVCRIATEAVRPDLAKSICDHADFRTTLGHYVGMTNSKEEQRLASNVWIRIEAS